MNDVPDETVILFVDGCMDREALIAFEARLANDPVLAKRVEAHRWMAQQIVAAHGPPEVAVDQSLIARLGLGDDNVIGILDCRRSVARGGIIWTARISAIAASLVLGIFVGQAMLRPGTAMIANIGGRPTASGDLAYGLSNQLTGESGSVRIGVSFKTGNGICRTFRTAQGVSGLGCREGTDWLVPVMATDGADHVAATEYRLASGDVAPSVMAEVDRRIHGEPLSVAEEARMKATGWR